MTQEKNRVEVPNLEATSDGKKIFTPKQWLERFRQYTKRKYKIDIAELIQGAEKTQNGWTDKEIETLKKDFLPRGLVPDDTGRLQHRTGQNSKTSFDHIIN